MAADFSGLIAEVTRLKGVTPSVIAALNGVADQIEAAVAADNAGDDTLINSLADDVRGQADELAAAVAAPGSTPGTSAKG